MLVSLMYAAGLESLRVPTQVLLFSIVLFLIAYGTFHHFVVAMKRDPRIILSGVFVGLYLQHPTTVLLLWISVFLVPHFPADFVGGVLAGLLQRCSFNSLIYSLSWVFVVSALDVLYKYYPKRVRWLPLKHGAALNALLCEELSGADPSKIFPFKIPIRLLLVFSTGDVRWVTRFIPPCVYELPYSTITARLAHMEHRGPPPGYVLII